MTLEFMEGFDWFTTNTKILQKWNSGSIGGVATTYPRYAGAQYAYNFGNLVKNITPSDVIVIGFALRLNSNQVKDFISFMETGIRHILIRIENMVILGRRDNTLLGTGTISLIEDTWHYFEIETTIHDTTGIIKVYVDGALSLNLTGVDTRNGGTGLVNNIRISGDNNDILIDDLYIKVGSGETAIGDVRVCTVLPNGAGTTTEWDPSAGSNYQNVDETNPDDDTTYNSTSTAGEIDLYAFPDIAVTAGTIHGVQVMANCRKDDAGVRDIKLIARPASTNHLSAAIGATNTYFGQTKIWEDNPETAAAWAVSEVNASEFGIEMDA
jgi:hypothetical protein